MFVIPQRKSVGHFRNQDNMTENKSGQSAKKKKIFWGSAVESISLKRAI